LRAIRSCVALPIVAIGGITAATMADALGAGADAVAMISEIVRTPDIGAKVRALLVQYAHMS
jgi:thiamine monophosphate synthase